MIETTSSATTRVLLQLALLQLICSLAFALVLYVCFTAFVGLSALLGGLIAVLANVYVALKVRRAVEPTPEASDELAPSVFMLQQFYRFEVSKVILTLTMFAISVLVIKVSILPFIIAYLVVALIVTWLALLVLDQ